MEGGGEVRDGTGNISGFGGGCCSDLVLHIY